LQEAQEMDCRLAEFNQPPQKYHQRLSGVNFKLYDSVSNDFQAGEEISLSNLIHIVGLLNVGKSTLLQIIIYHLAKKGYRCALVVDNVASQVRLASLFWFGLGIPAAPILGSDRAEHLKKVYEPILLNQGEDIDRGGVHPAWRWFSPVCPLLALVKSETPWEFGDEPCPKLYQEEKLVNWLGDSPFTGRSLFARLIRELDNPTDTETSDRKVKLTRTQKSKQREQTILKGLFSPQQKEHRKQLLKNLESFLQAPLNPAKGGKLATIALSLISANNDEFVFEELENWWNEWLKTNHITKLDQENLQQLKHRTYFVILITILENRLSFLIDRLNLIGRLIDLHELDRWLINRPPFDYTPIVPNSPVGNILGFKYTRDRVRACGADRNNKGGKLEYFRYVAVGRYLLLNFPNLFSVDEIEGCHTILISGTSYAPGSPAYHIREKPTILLEPASNNNKAGDAGIAQSKFYFAPQQFNGKYIAISGLLSDRRKQANEEMVKAICYAPVRTKSFLDLRFQELAEKAEEDAENWRDRSRILVINSSYIETELINSNLQKIYRPLIPDEIQGLIRDNNPDGDGIPRGKLENIKNTPVKILSAPLMSLERGHNILNQYNIAAFGTGIFINRPMPVPDDWQTTVRQLNAWTLDNVENLEFYLEAIDIDNDLTLATASTIFYGLAINKMIDLNCRAMSYKQLYKHERSVLCWTQLVSMWQVIGRLVRGGVPCNIYFLDIRFADNFAEEKQEDETSSLLVGIIKELEHLMQSDVPYELTLANSLYGAFLQALKNTEQLDYKN
jgi:hypothetical protein